MASLLKLAKWLGPWANESQSPKSVHTRLREIDGPKGPVRVLIYEPRGGWKARYVIAPGLHFAGADDPRMQRFCKILANCGLQIWAPYVEDYLLQTLSPHAVEDFVAVMEAALEDEVPTAVFSISFGSMLALRAACSESLRSRIRAIVLFGGYVDLDATIHFCMTGEVDGVSLGLHDPLNLPILFLHVVDCFEASDPDAIAEAWREYMRRTWGRPELRDGVAHHEIALEISPRFEIEHDRRVFEWGVGLHPEEGLVRLRAAVDAYDWGDLHLMEHLPDIECPVHIMHGTDDDVIPYTQLHALEAALKPHTEVRTYLTGLYGHTKKEGRVSNLVRELSTMVQMLRAIAGAPTTGE